MSTMKCPFCQQELQNLCAGVYTCSKPDSCPHEQCYGSKGLWQELIRTRKALDVAKEALNDIQFTDDGNQIVDIRSFAHHALEQITALEQKD